MGSDSPAPPPPLPFPPSAPPAPAHRPAAGPTPPGRAPSRCSSDPLTPARQGQSPPSPPVRSGVLGLGAWEQRRLAVPQSWDEGTGAERGPRGTEAEPRWQGASRQLNSLRLHEFPLLLSPYSHRKRSARNTPTCRVGFLLTGGFFLLSFICIS